MFDHQIIVIGGGLAGLRAAVEVHDLGLDAAIISRVHPLRSHSGAAQGGINASLGNNPQGRDDNWEKHAFDTIKGSDYLADQDAVEIMTREASLRIYEVEHWGVPFSRTDDGKISQRPFGGAEFPRTCYAADRTGLVMLHTLYEQTVKRGIKVYDDFLATSLIIENGSCYGVTALDILHGKLELFQSLAVVMAAGGAGRTYQKSTNAIIKTGSGIAAAYFAGVPLKDMEFVQFHPTSLVGTNILITEGARGEGGYLINNKNERFMKNYAPRLMEIAPRDIVARSIQTEINEGRGFNNEYVHLDLRHLGAKKIIEVLPGIREICINFTGLDPIKKPIPIQPAQHYTMGGIDTNSNGETIICGLFAAGECACVSVHGANRLGGNSLLETVVFGKIAGASAAQYLAGIERTHLKPSLKNAAQYLKNEEEKIKKLKDNQGNETGQTLRTELKSEMTQNVGIFRNRENLRKALNKVKELKERYKKISLSNQGTKYNLDLLRAFELKGKIELAQVIVEGALLREESRGSHYRLDFPKRDDQRFLKHTLAEYSLEGPKFSYKDVMITRFKPEERKY